MTRPSFRVVVATRANAADGGRLPIRRCIERMRLDDRFDVETDIAFGNRDGLPAVYNRRIDDEKSDGARQHDYVVFVHDDIWLNDVFAFDKIVSASQYFDVIGVCGGKGWESYGDGSVPIVWTYAAKNKGLSGFMAHAADDQQSRVKHDMTYEGRSIHSTDYGSSPSRTLTLDGCFLCFTRKAIESGLRFDERFPFHFYDMDVCFSAYVKGIRVGTAPLLLTHESLGLSVRQPQFLECQGAFLEKWFKRAQ